jgi:hypothetical protein
VPRRREVTPTVREGVEVGYQGTTNRRALATGQLQIVVGTMENLPDHYYSPQTFERIVLARVRHGACTSCGAKGLKGEKGDVSE